MFFPRFSTWSLLVLTGIAAAGFFVLGMAVEGYVWAGAASAVIVAGCVLALVHAALFAVVWALSQFLSRRQPQPGVGSDPFAQEPYPLAAPSLAARMGQDSASPFSNTPQSDGDDMTSESGSGNDRYHD